MLNTKFDDWCSAATAKIRCWRDRDAVAAELRGHLEDRYDAYVAAGLSRTEATAKTLEAMGSAQEIAPQLGKLHSPWLGWLYGFFQTVGMMTLVSAMLLFWYSGRWQSGVTAQEVQPVYLRSLIYSEREITNYENPVGQTELEGCHFRVTEAALVQYGYKSTMDLHMLVEVTWHPWNSGFYMEEYLWTRDSLGNIYDPITYSSDKEYGVPWMSVVSTGSGAPRETVLWITLGNFDPDADWVELCYDRDGRRMVLRIELTGGGEE